MPVVARFPGGPDYGASRHYTNYGQIRRDLCLNQDLSNRPKSGALAYVAVTGSEAINITLAEYQGTARRAESNGRRPARSGNGSA